MIYEEPRCLPAGDRYLLVEFGTESSLRLNLRALSLADELVAAKPDGLVETLPMMVTVLVHYDPTNLPFDRLVDMCLSIARGQDGTGDVQRVSRLIEIPVLYRDPWTLACVQDYAAKIHPIEDNVDFVVRTNDLSGPDQLFRMHTATQHWVGGVGFWPGLPDILPLDPRSELSVTKYDPPRVWTPPGAIGVGGGFTSIYPLKTPGGYQLIGRTPVPIFDMAQRLDPFRESVVLFRPGDRVKFVAISREQYDELEAEVEAGTYVYNIIDYEVFSLERYEQWLAQIDGNEQS
jgi:urea carboxylase